MSRKVHLFMAGVAAVLLIPGLTIWKDSVAFVIILSIWALVAAHLASAAAQGAKKAAEANNEQ